MSGLTGFIASNGQDLINIFQPLGSAVATNIFTNYVTNLQGALGNYDDLNQLFLPLGTNRMAPLTGYYYKDTDTDNSSKDLNQLFAGKDPFTTTGSPQVSYNNYNSIYTIIFYNNGSITFNTTINTASLTLVGGGGAGGGFSITYSVSNNGGGGGGGSEYYYNDNVQLLNATPYDIIIGAGGNSSIADMHNGSNSIITYGSSAIIKALGGIAGHDGGNTFSFPPPEYAYGYGGNGGGSSGSDGSGGAGGYKSSTVSVSATSGNSGTLNGGGGGGGVNILLTYGGGGGGGGGSGYNNSTYYGGGGGVGSSYNGGTGGFNGGGSGGNNTSLNGSNASNPGSGGGGASCAIPSGTTPANPILGGNGGNGICIITFTYP